MKKRLIHGFFGLQNLAPMSKFYLPRGPQLIFRAQLKIEYESKRTGKSILEILVLLLKQAKDMVKKETEEREKEEKLAKVVLEGLLKKKTSKEVLGKHIWQNRWFRLEQTPDTMHSRLVYSREKGSTTEGSIPLTNVKSVTVLERKKKEGRLDIELKAGLAEEHRMLALLASDEGKAKEWKDALSRILTLMYAQAPTQTENKFWYVTSDLVQAGHTLKKKKQDKDVLIDDHERKHVHFQDEVRPIGTIPLGRKSKEEDLSSAENSRTSVSSDTEEVESLQQEHPRGSGSSTLSIVTSKALNTHNNSTGASRLENGYTNPSSSSSFRSSTLTITTPPTSSTTTTPFSSSSTSTSSSQSTSNVPINLPITGTGTYRISSTLPNNNTTNTNNQESRNSLTIKTSASLSRNTLSTS